MEEKSTIKEKKIIKKKKPKKKQKPLLRRIKHKFTEGWLFPLSVSVLFGLLFSVLLLGVAFINYFFNKDIIDSIDPNSVHWWHFFTFGSYMAYMVIYQLPQALQICGWISIIVALLILSAFWLKDRYD